MNECDLILALGASFSNHTGITEKRPIIQVDFDRMQLGKFHPVTIPVWGEIGVTAKRLASGLSSTSHTVDQRPELEERWAIWREEKKNRATDDRGKGVNSASIFAALTQCAPDDAVIAVDVGNNTYSFGRYFESKGQRIMMSGYLGSIGFAFCAAMGAWAATQDQDEYKGRKVISISAHILLNNSELGKISKEQRAGEWPVWATDLHNPSFAAFADLCGGKGIKVTRIDELETAINDALEYSGPALVEIICDAQLV